MMLSRKDAAATALTALVVVTAGCAQAASAIGRFRPAARRGTPRHERRQSSGARSPSSSKGPADRPPLYDGGLVEPRRLRESGAAPIALRESVRRVLAKP